MSLMNVYVQPQAAHVVVDTDSMVDGQPGARIATSKFDLFPIARSVLAHVGRGDVAWHLRCALGSGWPQSFEALEGMLPGYLQSILDQFAEQEKPSGMDLASTFVLVGYSRTAGRFRCIAFDCKPDAAGVITVATIPAPDGCLTPAVPDRPFVFAGLDSMLEYGRLQVEYARVAHPGMACGGNLMAVTCLPESINVQDCGPVVPVLPGRV